MLKACIDDAGSAKGDASLPPGATADLPKAAKDEGDEIGAPPSSYNAEQGAAKGDAIAGGTTLNAGNARTRWCRKAMAPQ
jgi:hypothetical protein